jgi:translation initiation factor 3 subunit H
MLTALKDVQSDDNVVGFYYATPFNAFFTNNLLEMQSAHQARLRQGGIVVVHGQ